MTPRAARAFSSSSHVLLRRAAVTDFFKMYSDGRASEADKLMLTADASWEIYPTSVSRRVGGALTKDQDMAMMAGTLEQFESFAIEPYDMACEDHVRRTRARTSYSRTWAEKLSGRFL